MGKSLFQLFLLIFATFICFLDRTAFAYVILPIKNEFMFRSGEIGFIGAGFGIGYLLFVGIAGFIVERYGPFKIWAISATLWFVILLSTTQATNFISFFTLRILLGAVESVHFPCLIKVIFNWFDSEARSRPLALSLSAIPLSIILGGPFSSSFINRSDWKSVFIALALYSLIWAIISYFLIPAKKAPHTPFSGQTAKSEIKMFFSSTTFVAVCCMAFFFHFVGFFFLTWFPYYLEDVFQLRTQKAGLIDTIPWIFALLFLVVGGWLSDLLLKRTKSFHISRAYPMFIGYFLSALCFFLLAVVTNIELQIALFSLALGFIFLSFAPLMLLNLDLFPKHCSVAVGIFITFGAFAQIISPALVGIFRQSTGSFHSSLFLMGGITLLGAIVSFLFVKPKLHVS